MSGKMQNVMYTILSLSKMLKKSLRKSRLPLAIKIEFLKNEFRCRLTLLTMYFSFSTYCNTSVWIWPIDCKKEEFGWIISGNNGFVIWFDIWTLIGTGQLGIEVNIFLPFWVCFSVFIHSPPHSNLWNLSAYSDFLHLHCPACLFAYFTSSRLSFLSRAPSPPQLMFLSHLLKWELLPFLGERKAFSSSLLRPAPSLGNMWL